MTICRETASSRIQTIIDAIDQMRAVAEAIGARPESPMIEAFDKVALIAVEATEREITGKDTGWIGWFIWENDCGKRKMEAGYDGKMKPIETIDDLIDLMLEKKDQTNDLHHQEAHSGALNGGSQGRSGSNRACEQCITKLAAIIAKPLPPSPDQAGFDVFFSPWDDIIKNIHGGYSSESDDLMIETLEAVRDGTTFDLMKEKGFIIEFMLYALAGNNLTEYGTSPRGAWPLHRDLWQQLIDKWKAYREIAWRDGRE